MSLAHDEVAAELIAWRNRALHGVLGVVPGSAEEVRFSEHLSARRPLLHSDDVGSLVRTFLAGAPVYADWHAALLAPFRNKMSFERGQPKIGCGALSAWRTLTARFDPDALTAFCWARSGRASPTREEAYGPLWGFYLPMRDPAFERTMAEGLADIHVHLEACDPIPLLWLRVATRDVEVSHLKLFSDSTLASLASDQSALRRRRRDREELESAADRRRDLMSVLGIEAAAEGDLDRLREERVMLIAAWERILSRREPEVLGAYDAYLHRKNLFLRRHMQGTGQGAGLSRFRDFLDRGESLVEKRAKKVRPAVRRSRFSRMLALAREPAALRALELRIAPQKDLRGWIDFAKLWQAGFPEERSGRGNATSAEVRFVVHFIRNADPAGSSTCPMRFGRLRQALDRQSAVLQLFRMKHPSLSGMITGIDVANLERGCPPEIFAPYLKLLRNEADLAGDFDHPALRRWQALAGRDEHLAPARLPDLGLTYHAGEDFLHPVEGLRDMSGLLRNLLRSGDRIGHGLAAGLDAVKFQTRRGHVPLGAGILLDDLVWLRRELGRKGLWLGAWQAASDNAIASLSRAIYGQQVEHVVLERLLDARYRLPRRPLGRDPPEVALNWEEAIRQDVASRRTEPAPACWVETLYDAVPFVAGLQERLILDLMNAGVVVEINPSSNLVTGAVETLRDHPFFRFEEVLGDQNVITINTDDPGVFGTRLDVEFGLMFEAMLANGYGRAKALMTVDRMRLLGLGSAFG